MEDLRGEWLGAPRRRRTLGGEDVFGPVWDPAKGRSFSTEPEGAIGVLRLCSGSLSHDRRDGAVALPDRFQHPDGRLDQVNGAQATVTQQRGKLGDTREADLAHSEVSVNSLDRVPTDESCTMPRQSSENRAGGGGANTPARSSAR
jgi:hypothetical protein